MERYDFAVIGAGIAGASAAFALSEHGRVVVLEREKHAGYHSTGRSAALYTKALGHPIVRALTLASGEFFSDPPEGFTETPLLKARGVLFIASLDQAALFEEASSRALLCRFAALRCMTPQQAAALVPVLRQSALVGALYEPDGMDIDVHALHQGFLRGLKRRGGAVFTEAKVAELHFGSGHWRIVTNRGEFSAPIVVNAAGAWADQIARIAGLRPLGLRALRRTIVVFDPPNGVYVDRWPAVINIGERFYFKPDAGKLLASPADETPTEPCDVFPDEIDVAQAVERINTVTDLPVTHIRAKWAGLRSFVADRLPVVGFDPEAEGFFWLAGQGGFGIKTAPALSRLCASLAVDKSVPRDLERLGVSQSALSPSRFKGRT